MQCICSCILSLPHIHPIHPYELVSSPLLTISLHLDYPIPIYPSHYLTYHTYLTYPTYPTYPTYHTHDNSTDSILSCDSTNGNLASMCSTVLAIAVSFYKFLSNQIGGHSSSYISLHLKRNAPLLSWRLSIVTDQIGFVVRRFIRFIGEAIGGTGGIGGIGQIGQTEDALFAHVLLLVLSSMGLYLLAYLPSRLFSAYRRWSKGHRNNRDDRNDRDDRDDKDNSMYSVDRAAGGYSGSNEDYEEDECEGWYHYILYTSIKALGLVLLYNSSSNHTLCVVCMVLGMVCEYVMHSIRLVEMIYEAHTQEAVRYSSTGQV